MLAGPRRRRGRCEVPLSLCSITHPRRRKRHELFGVVIVTGIAWSTYRQPRFHLRADSTSKIRIGRSLLLGLEVFVAADIIKTVAHELTFLSLGLLAGL